MLASTVRKVQYDKGAGWVGPYPVTFRYFAKSEIIVVLSFDDAGVTPDSTLILDTDYTLTDPGASGTLTLVSVWDTDAVRVTIYRDMDMVQETDYVTGQAIAADTLETDFDLAAARDQEVEEPLDRTIRAPISDDNPTMTLPGATERANGYLGFNADGDVAIVTGILPGAVSVSAFGEDLVAESTAAAARATLGVGVDVWDNSKAYVTNELTLRTGVVYIAIQGGTNKDPTSQPTYWSRYTSTIKTLTDASYIVLDDDGYDTIILAANALGAERTITLPTAAANTGRKLTVLTLNAHGTYELVVDGEGAETINGTLVWKLNTIYQRVSFVCTGTAWVVTSAIGTRRTYADASAVAWGGAPATYKNLGGSVTLEPGIWRIHFSGIAQVDGVDDDTRTTLTAGFSVVNATTAPASPWSRRFQMGGGGYSSWQVPITIDFVATVAAASTFYLNASADNVGGLSDLTFGGNNCGTFITAERLA